MVGDWTLMSLGIKKHLCQWYHYGNFDFKLMLKQQNRGQYLFTFRMAAAWRECILHIHVVHPLLH